MMTTTLKTGIPFLKCSRSALALTTIAVVLQACGGGGSSDDSNPIDPGTSVVDPSDSVPAADDLNNDVTDVAVTNPDLLSGDVPRDESLADLPGSELYVDPNNSGILSGAVIGDGSIDNSAMLRSVPFEVASIPSSLQVEHVYATRTRSSDRFTKMIAIVRNVSSTGKCFVTSEDMTVLDRSGNTVDPTLGFASVYGNTYSLIAGLSSSTCLDPQQVGYLETDFEINLADIQAVNAGEFDATESDASNKAAPSLMPLSYEVLSDGNMEVMVVNQGLNSVGLDFAIAVILDSEGFPLDVTVGLASETLDPGAEGTVVVDTEDFEGSATSVRVFVY